MSAALLSSLPRDIPGLLLRASPIVYVGPDRRRHGWIGLIEQVYPDRQARIAWNAGVHSVERLEHVALDLTDATGRWHAALWLDNQPISLLRTAADVGPVALGEVMDAARRGAPMTPEQIDVLCRLCLRLAGRSHV